MILGDTFTHAHAEHLHRGVVMIYLLLFLIPIVAVLAWAARLDRNRRRREITGHDINTAVYTDRQDAERKNTEWAAGT